MIATHAEWLSLFAGLDLSRRPYFIAERGWRIFKSHLEEGKAVREIAFDNGLSVNWTRRILQEVEEHLLLPRKSDREWMELTLDSPIQDLGASLRTLNRLRDLGCVYVADVLQISANGSTLSTGARNELKGILRGHGMIHPAGDAEPREEDLRRLEKQIQDLRQKIGQSVSTWNERIRGMEARLHKLSNK